MLDTVRFTCPPPEEALKRLAQLGIKLDGPDSSAEHNGSSTLVIGGSDPAAGTCMLSWKKIAPASQAHTAAAAAAAADMGRVPTTTDQIMQAIVQYNRRKHMQHQHTDAAAASKAAEATVEDGDNPVDRQQQLLVVGYVMKPSREAALASTGLLHLLPKDGFCFMPVDLDTLQQQQQDDDEVIHIDILLHKGSDELVPLTPTTSSRNDGDAGDSPSVAAPESVAVAGGVSGTPSSSSSSSQGCPAAAVGVTWSPRLLALQSWLADHPRVCVVDPFQHTAKVLDRLLLANLLQQLQGLQLPGGVRARGPAFLEATSFAAAAELADAVAAAGLQPPFIVKPRVACGVAQSHNMALVLSSAGLQQLHGQLPLPALVQEFVNHGGQQYKVYVMGQQVFITPRASIPDIHVASSSTGQEQQQQQQCLFFDSLASLPTQLPQQVAVKQQQQQQQQEADGSNAAAAAAPAVEVVEAIAVFLRQHLGLTLFGFDVVVAASASAAAQGDKGSTSAQQQQQQQRPQELVVIDVNYFPNYKGGTDTPAMFRAALRQAWQQHQQQQRQQHQQQ